MQAKVHDSIKLVYLFHLTYIGYLFHLTYIVPSLLERCHNPAAGLVLLLLMPICKQGVAYAGTSPGRNHR